MLGAAGETHLLGVRLFPHEPSQQDPAPPQSLFVVTFGTLAVRVEALAKVLQRLARVLDPPEAERRRRTFEEVAARREDFEVPRLAAGGG